MPTSSAHPFILEGMLCGKNLESPNWRNILAQSNLLHLIVVSGSHLIFVESIFNKVIPKQKRLVWQIFVMLILFAYLLMTLMQPPVFRAFISLLLKKENQGFGSPLPDHLIVGASGFICLLFFPSWIHSWSLILSWLAALALANINALKECDLIMAQAWVSAFLFYPLTSMGLPHPIGILMGCLLLIPLSKWLLPICALTYCLPFLVPLFDIFISQLFRLLSQIKEFYPSHLLNMQFGKVDWSIWTYLLALHFLSWWFYLSIQRRQIQICR